MAKGTRSTWAMRELEMLASRSLSRFASEGDRYLQAFEKYLLARIPDRAPLAREVYKNLYHALHGLGWVAFSDWKAGFQPSDVEIKNMSGPTLLTGDISFYVAETYTLRLGEIVERLVFRSFPPQVLEQVEAELRRPPDIFGVLTHAIAGFAEDHWRHGRAGFDHVSEVVSKQPVLGEWKKLAGPGKPHVMKYDVSVTEDPAQRRYPTAGIIARWTGALQDEDKPKTWNPGAEHDRYQPLIPRRP